MPPGPPHYPFRLLSLSLIFGRRLRRSLDDLAGRFTAGLGEDGQWQPVACGRKLPLRWLQPRLFMLAGWPQGSCAFSSGWCNITCCIGTAYGGCSVICGWVRVSKMLDCWTKLHPSNLEHGSGAAKGALRLSFQQIPGFCSDIQPTPHLLASDTPFASHEG